jgi:hypothetical protein
METTRTSPFARFVLFSNGVVDLLAAAALFFPTFNLPLPGYASYPHPTAFVAGGWGIAALTFGVGRIWASWRPEVHRFMTVLGMLEAEILTAYCFIHVSFLETTLLQAALPLAIGACYSVLYWLALLALWRAAPAD